VQFEAIGGADEFRLPEWLELPNYSAKIPAARKLREVGSPPRTTAPGLGSPPPSKIWLSNITR
jgi:hypothetical protein